ncbi:MAG: 50S ribosomal protein L6 [Candidatus Parabeggiatoa sp. nov. 3]|jgi:large subunit ribosomal protein L6|nr:MAG: 50S ribosomal protein L6 [Gammaproteobacteria bacterium]RKZ69384.1 MAG: 50S ribosomal protein L6 [Gammaproteobacteria bacterium]RKZ90228.1 MAG: 50S ribosomal protein L6 [Gammaproteobacteria bacterium]
MSRIAKNPIPVQGGVEVTLQPHAIKIKGRQGSLEHLLHKEVEVKLTDNVLTFAPLTNTTAAKALAGTTRALINNMVQGVTRGFEKKLTLVGVGYRAQIQGSVLNLTLGFSHPVNFDIPEGITIETPSQTDIVVKGIDKQKVGQVAANIRAFRPPEPYKGKGVRLADEVIVMKEAKKK